MNPFHHDSIQMLLTITSHVKKSSPRRSFVTKYNSSSNFSDECHNLCSGCWSCSWNSKQVCYKWIVNIEEKRNIEFDFRFSPEQLGMHASSVMVWNIIEICVLCFTFYIFNVQSKLRTLDLIAYCGYKYVGMIAALCCYLATHSLFVYRCALLYVSLSLSYFLVRLSIFLFPIS